VISNEELSKERIRLKSKIKVERLIDKIHSGEFTIYEVSWGDKYGTRIELWFDPANRRRKNYKIAERNYIIEEWMR